MRYSTSYSYFSARIFRFAILAVLAAGVAVGPLRLAPQDSAPGSKSAPAAAGETAKPESAKSEEESTDQYRLTPLVQSIARVLFHDKEAAKELQQKHNETTARGLEFINFGIIALAIGIPLFRWMPKAIRKRGATIREGIESARKMTEDANARLSAIEAKLSGLDEEIAGIRAQVEQESFGDEARIKATIEEESARIVAAAAQEIGTAAAQAKRGLRDYGADLAIEQAARQLVLTPEADKALIAEFLGEVSKGGQN